MNKKFKRKGLGGMMEVREWAAKAVSVLTVSALQQYKSIEK